MPEPRDLGNVARAVVTAVTESLADNQDDYFEIVLNIHAGDVPAAIHTLKALAARNNIALRALTFLLANRQKDAEDVLIAAKLRQKKAE